MSTGYRMPWAAINRNKVSLRDTAKFTTNCECCGKLTNGTARCSLCASNPTKEPTYKMYTQKLAQGNLVEPKKYLSFANHSTASPGKDESTKWLTQNSKCTGEGVCLYLVGCPDGLERHILDKIDLGFTDLSKHIIVERDEETYNALKRKLACLAFKNAQYLKVKIRFGNIKQYLNSQVEHLDLDTNETYNVDVAEIIKQAHALEISNIHLTVASRNGVAYLQSQLGHNVPSIEGGVKELLYRDYGLAYNIIARTYVGVSHMLAFVFQRKEVAAMSDINLMTLLYQKIEKMEQKLGALRPVQSPEPLTRVNVPKSEQGDIIARCLKDGGTIHTAVEALQDRGMTEETARKRVARFLNTGNVDGEPIRDIRPRVAKS